MLRWTWVCVAVLLAGCFNATYHFEDGEIRCDEGSCPPGYTCHDLRCYRGEVTPDSSVPDAAVAFDGGVTCPSGTRRCSGNQPQLCTAGAWGDEPSCPADRPMCLLGSCVAGCKPGSKECTDRTLMECDLQGLWQPSQTCDAACYQGMCTGTCRPGERRCNGSIVEECGVRGSWLMSETCPNACVLGDCSGQCKPGGHRCSPDNALVPETCDDNGSWQPGAPCAFVCSGGVCGGACTGGPGPECTPCATKCENGIPYRCSAAGTWVAGAACSYVCVGTECGGECKPGARRCNGTTDLEVCSPAGSWQLDQTCPFGCRDASCTGCTPEPMSTTCEGRCGLIANNCGTMVNCGNTCPPGTSCGGGGISGACGCNPNSTAVTCAGKCGVVENNCGQLVTCNGTNGGITCHPAELCGAGNAVPNTCCVPDGQSVTCAGRCGQLDDNCGVTVACGDTCAAQGPLYICGGALPNRCGCSPNTKRCEGATPQTCSSAGVWVSGTTCPFVCEGGECAGLCTPGAKSCNGNTPRSCVGGIWVDAQPCQNSTCVAGVCSGVCVAGSHRCVDNTAQTCDEQGRWQGDGCSHQTCVNGACQGVCAPGETRCSMLASGVVEVCDNMGRWAMGQTCMFTCRQGGCAGECFPNAKQCAATPPPRTQKCDDNYMWKDLQVCPAPFVCNNGVCCETDAHACPGTGGAVCGAKVTKDCGLDVTCSSQCQPTFTCGANRPNVCGCKPGETMCAPDGGKLLTCNKDGDGWDTTSCPGVCCDSCPPAICSIGDICLACPVTPP